MVKNIADYIKLNLWTGMSVYERAFLFSTVLLQIITGNHCWDCWLYLGGFVRKRPHCVLLHRLCAELQLYAAGVSESVLW